MEDKPKRIRRDPEKHAAQKRAWKIAHRDRTAEQARIKRADPEKRAHERELERARRAAKRDELNKRRRGNRGPEHQRWKDRLVSDPLLVEAQRIKAREQMRRLRSDPAFRERENARERERYAADPTLGCGYTKKWRDAVENKGKVRAMWAKRRLAVLQQTPAWANPAAIADFYNHCPPGYHVDHIIPLRGKNVSGLHIETNLQYLPSTENLKKRNKF